MNRQFLVRMVQQERVTYHVIRGHREAVHLAQAVAARNRDRCVSVLDATGRIVWQADGCTAP